MPSYQRLTTESTGQVLSLTVATLPFQSVLDEIISLAHRAEPSYYCFANAHMAVEAWWDPALARQINAATRVVPDGMPLVLALRALYGCRAERVAGMDMLPVVLARAAAEGLPVYLYGGSPEVLEAATARLRAELPQLRLAGAVSPPFRPLTAEEQADYLSAIRASGARIVCVALGCPKQERWMAAHARSLPAVCLGIGGALPAYAGTHRRAPRWLQRLALEWAYRLAQEPRRLFRRYLVTNSAFLWHFAGQYLLGKRS